MRYSTCLVLFVATTSLPAALADDSRTDETAIVAVLKQQVQAWNRGDIEAFMATYWKSDKLTFSAGGHTTRGWQATLDRYKKRYPGRQAMGQLHFDRLEVTFVADNAAYVIGRWHLTKNKKPADGNFTIILRKQAEGWVIVHDHSSTVEKETDS